MLLWRLQLSLCRLLGVFRGCVRRPLCGCCRALVLFGGARLVREPGSWTVCHRQLCVLLLLLLLRLLLLLLLLLRLLLTLALLRLTATEVRVRGVEEEVPALRADLRRCGGGWSVNGPLWLEVLRRGDGWLADRVNCSRRGGQRGGGARPSGCLRYDTCQVLLLERLLRREERKLSKC